MTGANFTVRSAELFAACSRWCAAEGIDPGSNRALTEALISRGYDPPGHTRRGALWRGLALAADDGEGDGS